MGNDACDKREVPLRIRPAMLLLLEASQYAEQTNSDCWEFAVELDYLTAKGLIRNDYRWLVRYGLIKHQREVTLEGDDGRAFRATGDLSFSNDTCFILTDKGVLLARDIFQAAATNNTSSSSSTIASDGRNGEEVEECYESSTNRKQQNPVLSLPTWDAERRLLHINGTTVKHFKWMAVNQETILATFEEEGWPTRIYDPLTPQPKQNPKRRLSDTIRCLNRKQKNKLIHFRGDGTGEAVTWEPVEQNELDNELSD